jgi:hypothetical protein
MPACGATVLRVFHYIHQLMLYAVPEQCLLMHQTTLVLGNHPPLCRQFSRSRTAPPLVFLHIQ